MSPFSLGARNRVALGTQRLRIEDVVSLARGRAEPKLSPEVRARAEASHRLFRDQLDGGAKIYGVTTGYGDSVRNAVHPNDAANLSRNLVRFHGCGTGRLLHPTESAAVLAVRLASLSAGRSGVRPVVLERLCNMLAQRVLPVIPAEGSVGASGDLTPLSYVAATLMGEREAFGDDGCTPRPALEVLRSRGLEPLALEAKEALAIMNGTSVATALASLAIDRAELLARWASELSALACRAISGNPEAFHPAIHSAKGHPGQIEVAAWMRGTLLEVEGPDEPARLQDRYSIRCAPQVIGVLVDALAMYRGVVETELNGVSDNPLVDLSSGNILHGGNFYGGHIAFAMDGLKLAVANIADLLDRQVVLLCLPHENGGLPANLIGAENEAQLHHGFKAMSITASALTAEALKSTMPASAFSRSTESHNQDKVPMATIASRDALRVLELTERVAAVATLAVCQALDLRADRTGLRRHGSLHAKVRATVPRLIEDRAMDRDIAAVLDLVELDGLVSNRRNESNEPRQS